MEKALCSKAINKLFLSFYLPIQVQNRFYSPFIYS